MSFALKECQTCGFKFDKPSTIFLTCKRFRLCDRGHLWVNCRCNSTLIFPKAIHEPWFSESLSQISTNAQQFFATLSSPEKLPMPSSSIIKLSDTIDLIKEVSELSKAIDTDVGNKLLTNASVVSKAKTGGSISSIDHAITYLGLKSSIEIVKTFLFKTTLPSTTLSHNFWREAEITAEIATHLAALANIPKERWGEIYVAGKFSNIGKMVLYATNIEIFEKIMDICSSKALGYRLAESQVQATPHEALSELAVCLWGHKHSTIDIVGQHHKDPLGLPPLSSIEDWEIVALANQLAHWRLREPHMLDEKYMQRFLRRFGLSMEVAEEIAA